MSGNTSICIRSFQGLSRRSYIEIPTESSEMICYSIKYLTMQASISRTY